MLYRTVIERRVFGARRHSGASDAYSELTSLPPPRSAFTAPCGSAVRSPHGVATDSSSSVYIADTNNNRVLQLPW
jgi:NHL repeat